MSKSLRAQLCCGPSSFYFSIGRLLLPPDVQQPHTEFLIVLNTGFLYQDVRRDSQKLSSLPLPTSQMLWDGDLCVCKTCTANTFQCSSQKSKTVLFWLATFLLSARSTRLWHLDIRWLRALEWKNEISAQEDNVRDLQLRRLSYTTALSIFIQFPGHQEVTEKWKVTALHEQMTITGSNGGPFLVKMLSWTMTALA